MRISLDDLFRARAQQSRRRCIDITNEVEIGPAPYDRPRTPAVIKHTEPDTPTPTDPSNIEGRDQKRDNDNSEQIKTDTSIYSSDEHG